MSNLDVIFLNPNIAKECYQDLSLNVSAKEPPTWSLLLAESCRSRGYNVAILDCDAENLNDQQAIDRVSDINPKLVCFVNYGANPNASTQSMEGTFKLANKLKQQHPNIYTLSIGSHTSALPLEVLKEPGIDLVSINEGVYTLHDLLEYLSSTNPSGLDANKIRGLGWKYPVEKILCDDRPLAMLTRKTVEYKLNIAQIVPQSRMDIDLPGMAWDLIDLSKYRCHVWHNNYNPTTRSPFAAMYTSLGCPKKCMHCMINIVNRTNIDSNTNASHSNTIRYWSTSWVMNNLDILANKGVTNIRISDELFFLNKSHYEPILDSLIDRRDYKINSWTYSRYDSVKEKHLDKFKQAGINWLGIGVESGNQKIRQEIDKGKYKDVDIRDIFAKIKNAGINIGANYIYGFPNEKLENLQETFDLSVELGAELNNYYAAVALPGSPLYFEAIKQKWELPATLDGFGFLAYNHLPMRTHYLTAAEVLKFRDESWHKYFESPKYLNMIESKFGKIAREHIEKISKIKLKRKILGD